MLSKKIILVLLAFCCLLFAGLFYTRDTPNSQTTNELGVFIPGLEKRLPEVNSILLDSSEESIVLSKIGEQWKVASKDNYPANIAAIRQLLYGVAELEILEVKTSNESLLGEIDLTGDEDSIRIRLNEKENNSIADVLFGKSQVSLSGDGMDWFVRHFETPQSWLVKGHLNLYKSNYQWLNSRTILSLKSDELQKIELRPETDEVVRIIKRENGYILDNLGEGETAEYYKLELIVDSINDLQFDDVRVRGDIVLDEDTEAINVQTTDGLTILILITDVEQGWIVLQAIAAPADEKINEKAETYNQRWADWEYQIPKNKVEQWLNKKQDLLQQQETS